MEITSLSWIKAEIDAALMEACVGLQTYAEGGGDLSALETCANAINTVSDVLKTVCSTGGDLLASNIKEAITVLAKKSVDEQTSSQQCLMEAILTLGKYLEWTMAGQPDSPAILLPKINELRTSVGLTVLPEEATFGSDLDIEIPETEATGIPPEDLVGYARRLRSAYQRGLVAWLRGSRQGLALLLKVIGVLGATFSRYTFGRVWWAAGGLAEALYDGGLEADESIKSFFREGDRQLKYLAETGDLVLADVFPPQALRVVLYHVMRSRSNGEQVQRVRAVFGLDKLSLQADELERAIEDFRGPDFSTFVAVSTLVEDDIKNVKGILETHARSGKCSAEDLHHLAHVLSRLLGTLTTLGLPKESDLVADQLGLVESSAAEQASLDQDAIQSIADGLLQVESTLKHVDLWRFSVPNNEARGRATEELHLGLTLSATELGEIRALVAKEAKADLESIKDLLSDCVTSIPESHQVDNAGHLIDRISAVLGVAGLEEAEKLVSSFTGHLVHSLADAGTGPNVEGLEALAEAVIGIENYLQAVAEQQETATGLLRIAAAKLETLPPVMAPDANSETSGTDASASSGANVRTQVIEKQPSNSAVTVEFPEEHESAPTGPDNAAELAVSFTTGTALVPSPSAQLVGFRADGTDSFHRVASISASTAQAEAMAPAPNPTAATASDSLAESVVSEKEVERLGRADLSSNSATPHESAPRHRNQVDPEIAEIFAEEAQDVLASIRTELPKWQQNPVDAAALTALRRGFHTLKGSGRLAGAEEIGEVSWSVENLLNRVIDGMFEVEPTIFLLLDEVVAVLPQLVSSYRSGRSGTLDLKSLVRKIESFSTLGNEQPEGESQQQRETDTLPQALQEAMTIATLPAESLAIAQFNDNARSSSDSANPAVSTNFDSGSASAAQVSNLSKAPVPTNTSPELPLDACDSSRESGIPGSTVSTAAGGKVDTEEGSTAVTLKYELGESAAEMPLPVASPARGGPHAVAPGAIVSVAPSMSQQSARLDQSQEVEGAVHGPTDPVLLDLFIAEAHGHISIVRDFLDRCRQHEGEHFISEHVSRALHTLYGNARTAGIRPILRLVVEIEGHLEGLQGLELCPNSEQFRAIASAVEKIEETLASLESVNAKLPDGADLHSQRTGSAPDDLHFGKDSGNKPGQVLSSSAETADDAQRGSSVASRGETGEVYDHDLVSVFLEEASEILDSVDPLLDKWRSTPDDRAVIHELQRNLHTLKGGARMCGMGVMGDLSHALESVLTAAHEERLPVTDSLIDHVQQGEDRLLEMLQQVREQTLMQPADDVISSLHALLDNNEHTNVGGRAARQSREQFSAATSRKPAKQSAGNENRSVNETEKSGNRGQCFAVQVRVNSALVEKVANLGGEVSIARARIGQQISVLRSNLREMDETVDRLREQLRRMEIETEAQVLYRNEQSASVEGEHFDPLELDRYSQVQQLSRSVMESVSDLVSIRDLLEGWTSESETLLLQQACVVRELQQGLMAMRLVPFGGIVPRMRHVVRQTGRELGKKVQLRVTGAETEIDRTVLNRLAGCIEHMLRNAIDHGIESEDVRAERRKAAVGTVQLSVAREASEIVITVEDDGAGLPFEHIQRKSVERGLIGVDEKLSQQELAQFILKPAFSTASKLSQISGRGVGMDVVNTEIAELGGKLEIDSTSDRGTSFRVRLPFALNTTQALMVRIDEATFAIPHDTVEAVVRMSLQEGATLDDTSAEEFTYRGQSYRLCQLGQALGYACARPNSGVRYTPVLLARTGEYRAAFIVDELSGSQEIIIKPVGPMLSAVRWLSGATILPDGNVVLVLDLPSLVRVAAVTQRTPNQVKPADPAVSLVGKQTPGPTVLVVDDSITVRKVTSRLLESKGMRVVTAKDGVDAISALQNEIPDIMLLDVEMPRMDGYELAVQVRSDYRLKHLPMIMITSRTAEKHQDRAREVGVDRYLGKPYGEQELLGGIRELLAGT